MESAESSPETRRSLQAAATRSEIVDAAGRLMLRDGYVATSIGAIAAEARVAVQSIYNSVGNKAALLSAVLDRAAAGPTATLPIPAELRGRVGAAGHPAQIIRILAEWFVHVNERTARIHRVVGQAAAIDPGVAELERRRAIQRLLDYGDAAGALRSLRGMRADLSDPEAAALIWSLGHPQVYRTLVLDVGWSLEAYREWLEKSLHGALC